MELNLLTQSKIITWHFFLETIRLGEEKLYKKCLRTKKIWPESSKLIDLFYQIKNERMRRTIFLIFFIQSMKFDDEENWIPFAIYQSHAMQVNLILSKHFLRFFPRDFNYCNSVLKFLHKNSCVWLFTFIRHKHCVNISFFNGESAAMSLFYLVQFQ